MDSNVIAFSRCSNGSLSFISNTSPILWTDNIDEAKIFESADDLKNELDNNAEQLASLVKSTVIDRVWYIHVSKKIDKDLKED